MDAFTLLGDTMHLIFEHRKVLARAYDHVYYEGREIGNLLLKGYFVGVLDFLDECICRCTGNPLLTYS